MNWLSAPLYALFSVDFYRFVISLRVSKGFLYLLYLTCISSVLALFLFFTTGVPRVMQMIDWVKNEMPVLTVSAAGISMKANAPYAMVHPEMGTIAIFDMTKTDISPADMNDTLIYVTSQKVYVKQAANNIQEYDVPAMMSESEKGRESEAFLITPASIDHMFNVLKPWIAAASVLLFFVFFFVWKALVALFYSWIGLIINMTRHQKLTFSEVYNVSLFAMTASIVLGWLAFLVPVLERIPFGFFASFALTVFYLYLGIKFTDSGENPEPESWNEV